MGQQAQSVCYGVFLTPKQYGALRDEDGDWRAGIPDATGWRLESGERGVDVLAISVAVANAWEDRWGEVEMPECSVSELEKKLRVPIAAAKKRWKLLAKWAASHGVKLGAPELLLLEVERA